MDTILVNTVVASSRDDATTGGNIPAHCGLRDNHNGRFEGVDTIFADRAAGKANTPT